MKLSTRSRYGLRAMLVLALSEKGKSVMARAIAEKQKLPATYLEQLMLGLRKSNLVIATRGAHGGYVLARDPNDISLADIVEALDGALDISGCAGPQSCCSNGEACALKEVFAEANSALYNSFARISLAQLAEIQRNRDGALADMYFI